LNGGSEAGEAAFGEIGGYRLSSPIGVDALGSLHRGRPIDGRSKWVRLIPCADAAPRDVLALLQRSVAEARVVADEGAGGRRGRRAGAGDDGDVVPGR
jgi:hypothetical protein